MDPNDILVPTKYVGESGESSDIALIGLSKANRNFIINFFMKQKSNNLKEFMEYKQSICLKNNKIFSDL